MIITSFPLSSFKAAVKKHFTFFSSFICRTWLRLSCDCPLLINILCPKPCYAATIYDNVLKLTLMQRASKPWGKKYIFTSSRGANFPTFSEVIPRSGECYHTKLWWVLSRQAMVGALMPNYSESSHAKLWWVLSCQALVGAVTPSYSGWSHTKLCLVYISLVYT